MWRPEPVIVVRAMVKAYGVNTGKSGNVVWLQQYKRDRHLDRTMETLGAALLRSYVIAVSLIWSRKATTRQSNGDAAKGLHRFRGVFKARFDGTIPPTALHAVAVPLRRRRA
jgi:hypothetical protein